MEPAGLVSRNVCLEAFRKAFWRAQSVSISGGGAALSERLRERRLRGRFFERLCVKTLRKALRKAVRKEFRLKACSPKEFGKVEFSKFDI